MIIVSILASRCFLHISFCVEFNSTLLKAFKCVYTDVECKTCTRINHSSIVIIDKIKDVLSQITLSAETANSLEKMNPLLSHRCFTCFNLKISDYFKSTIG